MQRLCAKIRYARKLSEFRLEKFHGLSAGLHLSLLLISNYYLLTGKENVTLLFQR